MNEKTRAKKKEKMNKKSLVKSSGREVAKPVGRKFAPIAKTTKRRAPVQNSSSKKRSEPTSELAKDAQRAMQAVVQIHVRGYSEANLKSILDPRFALPEEWIGSGFFIQIDGEEGYI